MGGEVLDSETMMQPRVRTSSSATGSRECAPDDRLQRMIQYSETLRIFCYGGDYWIPAYAGMTAVL
jgi:hypothetical protein